MVTYKHIRNPLGTCHVSIRFSIWIRRQLLEMAGGVVSTVASVKMHLLVSNFQDAKEAREEPPAHLAKLFGAAVWCCHDHPSLTLEMFSEVSNPC